MDKQKRLFSRYVDEFELAIFAMPNELFEDSQTFATI